MRWRIPPGTRYRKACARVISVTAARIYSDLPVEVAGKTGTAEIKDSQDDTTGTELGWINVYTTEAENPVLLVSMIEDVKDRGGSGYVVDKIRQVLESYYQ